MENFSKGCLQDTGIILTKLFLRLTSYEETHLWTCQEKFTGIGNLATKSHRLSLPTSCLSKGQLHYEPVVGG